MADWTLASDGRTLVWTGSGGAPLLSGTQQTALRQQLASQPTSTTSSLGTPVVTQQGIPKLPPQPQPSSPAPGTGNVSYFSKGGTLPSGVSMVNGMPTATGYTPQSGDTVVTWPDGHQTYLLKSGLSVNVPAAGSSSSGGGGGIPAPAKSNTPTKVIGPQKPSDLLPAFSPPALNQFPNFYDPGRYVPVQGSSNIPSGYTGPTAPDIGGQASIAQTLNVPWNASTLDLQPGQAGYGMPPVDMSKGGGLQSNYVNPALYGYVSPTLAPAWYQGARSTSK